MNTNTTKKLSAALGLVLSLAALSANAADTARVERIVDLPAVTVQIGRAVQVVGVERGFEPGVYGGPDRRPPRVEVTLGCPEELVGDPPRAWAADLRRADLYLLRPGVMVDGALDDRHVLPGELPPVRPQAQHLIR